MSWAEAEYVISQLKAAIEGGGGGGGSSGQLVFVKDVDLTYSGSPSQRHNLTITDELAQYDTLIIACVTDAKENRVEVSSGRGTVLSSYTSYVDTYNVNGPAFLGFLVTVIGNASVNTVVSVVHYGTGRAKAIIYGTKGAAQVPEIKASNVIDSKITTNSSGGNVLTETYTAKRDCYVFVAYGGAELSEGDLAASATGGIIVWEMNGSIHQYKNLHLKLVKLSTGSTLTMTATVPVQIGAHHAMIGYVAVALT